MNVAQAMASILKKEGVELLFCYPSNKLIDEAAMLGIRPVVVRQERTGMHMADAYSRLSSGHKFGVFAMQHGPGIENSYGSVAQAYADSVPVLVVPQGYPQRVAGIKPNFSAAQSMRDITKSAEALNLPGEVVNVMRRALSQLRNGRGGPVLVEVPNDLWTAELGQPEEYVPVRSHRTAPDPDDIVRAADLIASARNLVIHAGQGVHYARAWDELRALAERLACPVVTTLPGKSSFPEDHPLSLGSGGLTYPMPVKDFLDEADVILGIGCSFTETLFAVPVPKRKRIIHMTLDPAHLNKDVEVEVGVLGDAKLSLQALIAELERRGLRSDKGEDVAARIRSARETWLAQWLPKLTSTETPINPYRVVWELMDITRDEPTIITNDAGRPRDQLTPFWVAREPLSFIGWGKTTQLGYGLGIAMGAKLACPDKLCINVWGDAAIGFTGMDIETAAREGIAILTILFNNGGMATELNNMPNAIRLYDAHRITGNYCDMARAFGAYAERIADPAAIRGAIERGIAKTREGRPVLLEFITAQETAMSKA